jgi:hypothetical protein
MIDDSFENWGYMLIATISLLCLLTACESATQTAVRENEPPAVAYIVAAESGKPLPAAVIIQPANNQ